MNQHSGYIYLLPQSSPLAQCRTATTCTIQTRLCSVPLWTEDLWGALWHVNLLFFFSVDPRGDWTPDLQHERQALYHWAKSGGIASTKHVQVLKYTWWSHHNMLIAPFHHPRNTPKPESPKIVLFWSVSLGAVAAWNKKFYMRLIANWHTKSSPIG